MFRESLFWMPALGWLAATIDESLEHQPPTRDIEWAHATLHAHDGSETNLSPLLTIPVDADLAASRRMAGLGDPAGADALRRATRQMPRWIFPLEGSRVLCAYHTHHAPVLFRLLDLATAQEVQRFNGADLHAEVSGTPPLTDAAARAAADWAAGKVFDSDLFAALKLRPMAASEDRLLVDTGMGRALLDWSGEDFRLLRVWHSMFGAAPAAARTVDGFVFLCGGERGEPDTVRHASSKDGSDLDAWPPGYGQHVSGIFGEQPPGKAVVITLFDGPVLTWCTSRAGPWEVDMTTDVIERVSAAIGNGESLLAMRFGDDASEIVVRKSGSGKVLVMLRLHALDPSVSIFSLPQPGFALGPDELVTLCQGRLTRIPYADLPWGSYW